MAELPAGFREARDAAVEGSADVRGHLTARESRFLFLLAAWPTARGDLLEIGSFRGRSTGILARGARLGGQGRVVAVDPLTNPSETDPGPTLDEPALEEFRANLERVGVAGEVEFHPTLSSELAREWDRPLRLLWIDGDHTYPGTLADVEDFRPNLEPGAVVAIHDVLNRFEGSLRVYMEEVLLSDAFGPAGMCGSIGWAVWMGGERRGGPGRPWREARLALYRRLAPLVPFSLDGVPPPEGLERIRFKWRRSRVPHGEPDAAQWVREVERAVRDLPGRPEAGTP